jgi:LuxR family transcriptional activator of conjugal transfer of Ti plasmids
MSRQTVPSATYLADPSVSDPVLGFAETSHSARNADELDATMADYMRRFDVRTFVLCQATDSKRRPTAARIAGKSNMEWRRHYDASGFAAADDLLTYGLTNDAPVTWNTFRQGRPAKGRKADLYEDARAFGLHDGFYLPIRQRDGSMVAVSMMASQELPQTRTILAALHMLAIYYHMAADRLSLLQGLVPLAESDRPVLTPRQMECLRWVAEGETASEIGRILTLSEHTVNEHLQGARKRLGVRTTTQAVTAAIACKLIQM